MENSISCEWFTNSGSEYYYSTSSSTQRLFEEERGLNMSASKSHSEAEKRRRDRINTQLSTLRKLIPKSEKMDKAALLSSVVDHVKELKRKATEIGKALSDVPTDTDEVIIADIARHPTTTNDRPPAESLLRASVCCDDRPELFSDINRALKDLKLVTAQADVTSLGGRVKSVFVLVCPNNNISNDDDDYKIFINSIKQSLKVALCKIVTPSSTTSYRIKSKRQRFFLPAHYH